MIEIIYIVHIHYINIHQLYNTHEYWLLYDKKKRGISATLLCSCCSLCRYRHIFGYSLVRGLWFHTIAMFNMFQPHLPSTSLFLAIPIMECNDIIFSIGWNSYIYIYINIYINNRPMGLLSCSPGEHGACSTPGLFDLGRLLADGLEMLLTLLLQLEAPWIVAAGYVLYGYVVI